MNKRVEELYRQAHSVRSWDGDPWRKGNPPTIFWEGEISAKKFAELIVRECILALDEADGSVHHSECLLEHFGVEE